MNEPSSSPDHELEQDAEHGNPPQTEGGAQDDVTLLTTPSTGDNDVSPTKETEGENSATTAVSPIDEEGDITLLSAPPTEKADISPINDGKTESGAVSQSIKVEGEDSKSHPPLPTSDERLLAALSHFMGLFIALMVLITQKDKSRFLRFQASQAIAFDLLVGVALMLTVGVMMVLMLGTFFLSGIMTFVAASMPADAGPDGFLIPIFMLPTIFPFFVMCLVMPIAVGTLIARLLAALQVFQGKDFRYPWLGRKVENFLDQS